MSKTCSFYLETCRALSSSVQQGHRLDCHQRCFPMTVTFAITGVWDGEMSVGWGNREKAILMEMWGEDKTLQMWEFGHFILMIDVLSLI